MALFTPPIPTSMIATEIINLTHPFLAENHQKNYTAFCDSLETHDVVIVDNTNTQEWEYEGYVRRAEAASYQVVYVVLKPSLRDAQVYADRNTHGVPLDAIQRQIARFE